MLADAPRENDIVIVAAWPSEHWPLTMQALESGRHVLCEKPLAVSVPEARAMLDKARAVKRMLGCCSTRFLGLNVSEAVKNYLEEEKLGNLYHVRWCCRCRRTRPGIEYQPETPWFLERRYAGGGILLDWAPYDFTLLNDILKPVRVEVLQAWTAAPETHTVLPEGVAIDVEFHGAAWMVYHLPNGQCVRVGYERSSCIHGEERRIFEFEGTRGALSLDWLGDGGLRYSYDKQGQPVSVQIPCAAETHGIMERPIRFFHQAVNGGGGFAVLNEKAVFNFSCIQAIYACAATGQPQTVCKETV
jgi:predicted dehydrogenase